MSSLSSDSTTNQNIAYQQKWYVIYTKSRHEKKVANLLNQSGIEAFCPQKTVIKQWKDRKKKVEVPLFSSYCFVKIEESNLRDVFKIQGVVRYIYWCGKPAIVNNGEMNELKRWLNDYEHDTINIEYLKPEQKVIILSGAFINNEATVLSQNGQNVVLKLSNLGIKLFTKVNQVVLQKAV